MNSIFTEQIGGQTVLRAMPILLGVLCILAIAYRYYSAFLAARVAMLDDSRVTPAHTFNDGQNYHPTNKWVLFGHHFAAISGAGPLIGPVLAIQYGYMPGSALARDRRAVWQERCRTCWCWRHRCGAGANRWRRSR